jgi:membrane protease YdiL (CAAX protease family)
MKRSLWVQLFLFVALIALAVLGYLFLLSLFRNMAGGSALAAAFLAAVCLAVNVGFFRSEGRTTRDIGLNAPKLRITQFALGFLSGGILVLTWAATIVTVGSARWHFQSGLNLADAVALAVFYLFNNAGEELAYRGFAFLRLEERSGRGVAIIATSMAFALMHFQGGMPLLNALVGVLTNGLIFAALFSRWKSLPLVLGFHFATNIFQDVYGLRQSGLSLAEFKNVNLSGGREVGMLALVGCINLAVLLFVLWPLLFSRKRPTT